LIQTVNYSANSDLLTKLGLKKAFGGSSGNSAFPKFFKRVPGHITLRNWV